MRKIILILILLLISGCEKPIGGERDEHGCLGAAGYTWNEDIKACVREWELNENQREAAKKAVEFIGEQKGLTIVEVMVARCPGCFVVKFNKYDKNFEISLENWKVKDLSPEECLEKGGRTVNIVGGDICEKNEVNIGKVVGFISPNICCLAI